MKNPFLRKILAVAVGAVVAPLLVFGVEILIAIPGPDDHFHNPSRQPVSFGAHGKPLVYVVMGDSTAAGRGGDYAKGIAMATAHHLAQSRSITLINLAVSGAKVNDVVRDQLPAAIRLKPDIVLLAIGANDVTHFTSSRKIEDGLTAIFTGLGAASPRVRIVITGSPDMGAVRRLAQPLRWLAGVETGRVNRAVEAARVKSSSPWEPIVWAYIARDTGPLFRKDATLLAPDRFHPNNRGYATWIPILNAALDRAIR